MSYRYGIGKLKVPGFFTFDKQPADGVLQIGIALFFVFILVSFLFQSFREFPKFANDFKSYKKFFGTNVNFFDRSFVEEGTIALSMNRLSDSARRTQNYSSEDELVQSTQDVAANIETLLLVLKYKTTEMESFDSHLDLVFPSSEDGWPTFQRLYSNMNISGESFSKHFSRTYATLDFQALHPKASRILEEVGDFVRTFSNNLDEAKTLNESFLERLPSQRFLHFGHSTLLSFWVPLLTSIGLVGIALFLGPETPQPKICEVIAK